MHTYFSNLIFQPFSLHFFVWQLFQYSRPSTLETSFCLEVWRLKFRLLPSRPVSLLWQELRTCNNLLYDVDVLVMADGDLRVSYSVTTCGFDCMISKLSTEDSGLYLFMPFQDCNPSLMTHCYPVFTFQLSIHDSTGTVFPLDSFLESVCHVREVCWVPDWCDGYLWSIFQFQSNESKTLRKNLEADAPVSAEPGNWCSSICRTWKLKPQYL